MSIIEFDNVIFSYDGKENALDGVSLSIEPGEFVCVLGGNGSGKSTLAKHINALLVPDAGQVSVLGMDTANAENTFAIRSSAGMVFQNPDDQLVASIIEDDVAFGPENLGVEPAVIRERVTRALTQVGLQGFEKKETAALSGGQKQRVAIAGVLAMEPQVIVLDEAAAMLDPRGRAGLMRVCRELNEAGMTIVMITHFMEDAAEADRVIVLDSGRVALEGTPAEVFVRTDVLERLALEVPFATKLSCALRERGVDVPVRVNEDELADGLRALTDGSVAGAAAVGRMGASGSGIAEASGQGASAIELAGVSYTYQPAPKGKHKRNVVATDAVPADWGNDPADYWALRDVSLAIEAGEFFGIAGHTGSGKSTLIQLCNGLLQPTAGTVTAAGRQLADRKAAAEARRDVGVVFQYPEHQLFAATVFDDVAFGPRNLGLGEPEVAERVREALALVHLDADELGGKSPFALSGGQQRRVAFAGVLAMRPKTLILDEPVAGLDPRARESFLGLIREFHEQQGMTVVLVSHNMNDLAALCGRMVVLNRGEVFAEGAPADVFALGDALKGVGLGLPDTLRMARSLGLDVDGVPTVGELADAIARSMGRDRAGGYSGACESEAGVPESRTGGSTAVQAGETVPPSDAATGEW